MSEQHPPYGRKFLPTSERRLSEVNKNLAIVARRAKQISRVDFEITSGLRSKDEQARLVAKGASRTMNSKHLTGHAVDVVAVLDNKKTLKSISWSLAYYGQIAVAFMNEAAAEGVNIEWGGNWKLVDGPHFQLND